MQNNSEIIFTETTGNNGNLGLITLNRPQAFNALNLAIINALDKQLRVWATDPNIKAVVVQSSGEKAFCAGGDIRQNYTTGKTNIALATLFFWHKYRSNHLIHHYSKPYIALVNGITMGGGVGISEHGSYRVATEKLTFAMPETGIGFFPDVGGSYFLPRLPGQNGIYLGLTGARSNAADAQYLTLIDYCVATEKLPEIILALAASDFGSDADTAIKTCLQTFAIKPAQASLAEYRNNIDACFQYNRIEDIFTALEKQSDEWCRNTAKLLLSKSPTSLKVTLQQLRRGTNLGFDQALQMEYRLVTRFLPGHDFYEGVRAAIIDKDQKPQWQPARLAEVKDADVNAYFAPLVDAPELNFN